MKKIKAKGESRKKEVKEMLEDYYKQVKSIVPIEPITISKRLGFDGNYLGY